MDNSAKEKQVTTDIPQLLQNLALTLEKFNG